ncbi:alpha/beta hydrolase [Jatrophihabitans telluris]|uniref:Alpha/beta hydrolase n=1 Tax=Jatrophihabitans telluris TaxID=2038343 RepID=A0ABY4QSZ9_9ACTN|nr:alpha/beta hydrolase [Jatrophihabitans telluris]UQX86717.1 alpha/beta hydrolase [Jatrophihabitans telluris]
MSTPTVVLLHGQPDSSASFWALRHALAGRLPESVRVIAPDRPGYGANPAHATDFEGNVAWLRQWLRRISAGPVVLVGHSWAGAVAALAAADAATDSGLPIAALLLLSSIGPGCLLPLDPWLAAPGLGEAIAYTTLGLGRGPVTRKVAHILRRYTPPDDVPYAWASGAATRHRPLWRSFLTEQRAMVAKLGDVDRRLPQIQVPTLVVSGTSDSVIPARTPQALAAAIPGSRHVPIAGGHDLQLRQPDAVAVHIAGLVEQVW